MDDRMSPKQNDSEQFTESARAIRIAVLAMGGEGGGVLANWLIDLARRNDYVGQMTSVPGVAQRTGATIYYIEIFPKSQIGAGQHPVLALMPVPGDVDIVMASELMEAGRAIQRGIVTPDRTALIASSHRVFSMTERVAMADGRVDAVALLQACRTAAQRFIAFDMMRLAEQNGSVISSVMFGALAGSGLLPFDRVAFEKTIQEGGVGVRASLQAFSAGYEAVKNGSVSQTEQHDLPIQRPPETIADLQNTATRGLPHQAQLFVKAGIEQCADWQDFDYAKTYVALLQPLIALEQKNKRDDWPLLQEVARQLALGLCYEDTIRVADLKIRATRFERVAKEVGIKNNQILEIREYLHPRKQEIIEVLPGALGRFLGGSKWITGLIDRFTNEGRVIETTSIHGFLLLYCVAQLRRWRRSSARFAHEHKQLHDWLDLVMETAQKNYDLALELAELRGLVKGYGDTHATSVEKYNKIIKAVPALKEQDAAQTLKSLRKAAQTDDGGAILEQLLSQIKSPAH